MPPVHWISEEAKMEAREKLQLGSEDPGSVKRVTRRRGLLLRK
jgi:hypothetical protein